MCRTTMSVPPPAAPTAVSQHLARLRLAGLVKGRREGTFVYYSAAADHVRRLLDQALFHADHLDRKPDRPAGLGRPEPEDTPLHRGNESGGRAVRSST